MTDDAVQLRQFVETGDEQAFCSLVDRHFNLVYGAALRLTNRDASLAEDVAQTVFTDLARKARYLSHETVLTGWLYRAACFSAAKVVRGEQRRRAREREAVLMQQLEPESSPEWERLRPVLDAALRQLSVTDRAAVLMHYFEQRSFREVGALLGLSDDAAQKRVSRALDKLRTALQRCGVTVSGAVLPNILAGAAPPVPAGLARSVAKLSLAKAAALGPAHALALLNPAGLKIALVCLLTLMLGLKFFILPAHPVVNRAAFVTIDLSPYYNGSLDKSWTPEYGNNSLAEIGEGEKILQGVPFALHGLVQLQGAEWKRRGYNFPESVAGIPIGTTARRIHLLHANSAFADPVGTIVATLVLHYTDGDQAEFLLRQGADLLDWWDWPRAPVQKPTGANTVVAWRGHNPPAEHQGARVRLFETVLANPHPEKTIQSVDYNSAMAGSAPFMVALTLEH